ncbi:hypothetical protein RFI_27089, partial [Reticulomyxa filosa]
TNWDMRWNIDGCNVGEKERFPPKKYWEYYDLATKSSYVRDKVRHGSKTTKTKMRTVAKTIATVIIAGIGMKLTMSDKWGIGSSLALWLVLGLSLYWLGWLPWMSTKDNDNDNDNDNIEIELEEKEMSYHYLFVYGTLKSNFHWNQKYLSHSQLISSRVVTCRNYALIIGDCGVPYLLNDNKYSSFLKAEQIQQLPRIQGELWLVDSETLFGLDQYEGIDKNYYIRKWIDVVTHDNNVVSANVYLLDKYDHTLLNDHTTFFDVYSLQYHKLHYSAIKHIQVKQLAYLNEDHSRT